MDDRIPPGPWTEAANSELIDAGPHMLALLLRADEAATSDLERSDRSWFGDVRTLLERLGVKARPTGKTGTPELERMFSEAEDAVDALHDFGAHEVYCKRCGLSGYLALSRPCSPGGKL